MTHTYKGFNGKTYTAIEPALGKGGEGAIYRLSENPTFVIKVFNERNRTEYKHEKILAMLNTPLSLLALQQITWPIDILYDDNHNFVGYVMSEIKNNEELNVMYSGKYICPLNKKIIIAKNLCCVLAALHNSEIVIGDFNPKNIIVDKETGLVTLIDTDSYSIKDKNSGKEYRCEVGLPEYIAKELQEKLQQNRGEDLRTLSLPTFTKETDLFALAVHIFALLMNGCHPFACVIDRDKCIESQKSLSAPQSIENIRNGFFPFYMKKNNIKTPSYAPDFDFLPDNLKELFIRAFTMTPKDRPSAKEWFNELNDAQNELKVCIKDKNHAYFEHQDTCFFCNLRKETLIELPETVGNSRIPHDWV